MVLTDIERAILTRHFIELYRKAGRKTEPSFTDEQLIEWSARKYVSVVANNDERISRAFQRS